MTDLIVGSAAILAVGFAAFRYRYDASIALGATVLIGFFFPTYWEINVLGLPITVQTLSAIIGLFGYTLSGGSLRFRLTICDLAVGTVLLAHVASDCLIHGGGWMTPLFAYGEWMLPYASGRYALGRISAYYQLRFITIALMIYLGVLFVVDVVGGVNVLYDITSGWTGWEAPLRAKRFGLVRSAGTTAHPIFFSGMIIALSPVIALSFCRNRTIRPGWIYGVSLGVLLLVTLLLSRAAVIAVLVAALASLLFRSRRSRPVVAVGLVAAIVLVTLNRDTALQIWQKTGGRTDDRKQVVVVDGEKTLHNSSLARLRLYDVYGTAALRAGVFGYGTSSVTGFPPNLPYLPKEALAIKTVWTVENSYLLMLLRFGWVGLAAMFMLTLSPIAMTAGQPDMELREHLWCLTASILGIAVLLVTVYSAYEITFPWLWLLGLASALMDPRVPSTRPIHRS